MIDEKLRRRICNQVERSAAATIEDIRTLVRIPSLVGQEGAAQDFIADRFRNLGLELDVFEADRAVVSRHPAYTEVEWGYEGRPNVVGILRGRDHGRSLAMNGHVDVVSPEPLAGWTHDPWGGEREGNRLYGRGALDMKAGAIANIYAVKALLDLGLRPKGAVILHSVIEEEAGEGGGTLATLLRGHTAEALWIPEPLDMSLVLAHPGVNYFRVRLQGKTAHAGQSHYGINAIGLAARIYDRLVALDRERASQFRDPFFEQWTDRAINLNVGTMRAGDWVSSVAGWAEISCRISYIPPETEAQMRASVARAVQEVADADPWLGEHPPEIEWFGWHAEPWAQDLTSPFVNLCREVVTDVVGTPPREMASTAGLDNRFASYFGMQSVCYGPRGERPHGPDECVELDSVLDVTKVAACLIAAWCGVG